MKTKELGLSSTYLTDCWECCLRIDPRAISCVVSLLYFVAAPFTVIGYDILRLWMACNDVERSFFYWSFLLNSPELTEVSHENNQCWVRFWNWLFPGHQSNDTQCLNNSVITHPFPRSSPMHVFLDLLLFLKHKQQTVGTDNLGDK